MFFVLASEYTLANNRVLDKRHKSLYIQDVRKSVPKHGKITTDSAGLLSTFVRNINLLTYLLNYLSIKLIQPSQVLVN